jgi:hypothetical protein
MVRFGRLWSIQVIVGAVLIAGISIISCGNINGTQPSPPTSFLLTAPTNSYIVDGAPPTLFWTNSGGQSRYYVQFDDDPAFATPYTASVAADRTSYTVLASTLTASTKYYWRVRAVNNSGATTAANAPFSFTTTTAPILDFSLKAPSSGSTIASLTPTLEWTDAGNESGYIVHISTLPTFTTGHYTALVSANTTSYIHSDPSYSLVSGTQYYWEVLATFSGGGDPITATNAPFSFVTP